jgi:hypothetical protein
MRPRPARRRVQPWAHQAPASLPASNLDRFLWLRRVTAIFGAAAFLGIVGYGLFAKAPVDCLTSLHTFCTDEEAQALQARYPNRLANMRAKPASDITEFQKQFSDWQDLSVHLSWRGKNMVRIARSETIATVRVGDRIVEVLSNGQQRPGSSSTVIVQFESPDSWNSWLKSYDDQADGLLVLKTLAHDLQTLRPRPTIAIVRNKDEVELRLENSSRALIHLHSAGEVQQQLRTLQAVFTSSTMEQQPGEVDVRFKNVITR